MYKNKIFWSSFVAIIATMAIANCAKAQNHDSGGTNISSPTSVPIDPLNGNGIPNTTTVDPGTRIITIDGIDIPISFGTSSGTGTGTGSSAGTSSGSGTDSTLGETKPGESVPNSASGDTGTVDGQTPNSSENSGSGNSVAKGKEGDCLTTACLEAKGEPQELTINDVAELLENNLDDTLATIERGNSEGSGVARTDSPEQPRRILRNNNTRRNTLGGEPRRIARQSSGCGSGCVNPEIPTVEARQQKLEEQDLQQVVERQLVETQRFIKQVNNIDPEKNIW